MAASAGPTAASSAPDDFFVYSPVEETVIQHLGFVFTKFTDEIFDAANEAIKTSLNDFEEFVTLEYDGAGVDEEVPDLEREKVRLIWEHRRKHAATERKKICGPF
jgi:hypothetical protein